MIEFDSNNKRYGKIVKVESATFSVEFDPAYKPAQFRCSELLGPDAAVGLEVVEHRQITWTDAPDYIRVMAAR